MTDLLAKTAEMVAVPSVSGEERRLADHVESSLRQASWLDVTRVGDNVVARTQFGLPVRVALAGHLDTVPANGNEHPRTDGEALWGLGSADMKGGLAVMVDLATNLDRPECDVTYVFYVNEEVARAKSGLLAVAAARPELLAASAAIVCEPTNAAVEAGCQGVLRAQVQLVGERAHVARPWTGRNAVHLLGPLLVGIATLPTRQVEIDGCTFRESLQAVRAWGGVASNVVPDRAGVELNYRFAPDRSTDEAAQRLRAILAGWLGEGGSVDIVDSAPAAPPHLDHPVLATLARAAGGPVTGKLGWTDVAFFAERGVPAANFGPGAPELAHTAGEHVTRASLDRAREVLGRLLGER